jgi:hypothetical protein
MSRHSSCLWAGLKTKQNRFNIKNFNKRRTDNVQQTQAIEPSVEKICVRGDSPRDDPKNLDPDTAGCRQQQKAKKRGDSSCGRHAGVITPSPFTSKQAHPSERCISIVDNALSAMEIHVPHERLRILPSLYLVSTALRSHHVRPQSFTIGL